MDTPAKFKSDVSQLGAIADVNRVFDGYFSGDWTNFSKDDNAQWWTTEEAMPDIASKTKNRDRPVR